MGNARNRQVLAVVTLLFVFAWHSASFAQSAPATKTQVVMLGTGTPLPDPDRSGPSTAIVVNGTGYIVDAGTGVVRRAAAARDKGVKALEPTNLRLAFLTHLHADHTLGLPDLILTPWIMGRKEPLELYGPVGTREMVEHILQAYDVDIKVRTEGLEHSNRTGYKVNVHEITPGVVYKDANITVKPSGRIYLAGVWKRVTVVLAGGLIPAGRQVLPDYGRVARDTTRIRTTLLSRECYRLITSTTGQVFR
jgi:hypothetical protein